MTIMNFHVMTVMFSIFFILKVGLIRLKISYQQHPQGGQFSTQRA